MTTAATRPGPNGRARPSLGDQLDRLDCILNGLADALNESVTAAVTAAAGKAVREAVESATRELAARPIPPATEITGLDVTVERPMGRHELGRTWLAARRVLAQACRAAGQVFRRLGMPLADVARRAVHSPRRFLAFAVTGVVAGTAAGLEGPWIGAALGGLAGTAISLSATPPR